MVIEIFLLFKMNIIRAVHPGSLAKPLVIFRRLVNLSLWRGGAVVEEQFL